MKCKVCGKIEDKLGRKCSACFKAKKPIPGYYTKKKIERLEDYIITLHDIIYNQDLIIEDLKHGRRKRIIII